MGRQLEAAELLRDRDPCEPGVDQSFDDRLRQPSIGLGPVAVGPDQRRQLAGRRRGARLHGALQALTRPRAPADRTGARSRSPG